MASRGRPPKAKVETTNTVDEEKELLKQQIEEMKAQMELMMQQVNVPSPIQPKAKDKLITFINLVPGTLVLRGSHTWIIEGQFNKRSFTEREAVVILNSAGNLIRNGCVYITDAQFVEDNNILDSYNYLIPVDKLQKLFEYDANTVVELYNSTTEAQRKIIVDMIAQKISNNEDVDANILKKIGKLAGVDFSVYEPLEEE